MKGKRKEIWLSKSRTASASTRVVNGDPIETSALKHSFDLQTFKVRSVNVTPNDRYLILTNQMNNLIRVVDLELLEIHLPQKFKGHRDTVRLTSATPDSWYFYSGSWDGTIRKYALETGVCLETYSGEFGRIPSVYIDPNGKYLFMASYDSDINISFNNSGRCWDILKKEIINQYRHEFLRKRPEAIDIAYDQQNVYTGSDDGCARRWDLTGSFNLQYFKEEGVCIRKIAVSQHFFVAACTNGMIKIYHKLSGELIKNIVHNAAAETMDVKISKDESRLYSGSADGSLLCVDLSSFKEIFHNHVHSDMVWSICLGYDDRILVTGSWDGTVAFLNTENGDVLAQYFNSAHHDFLITCPPDNVFPNGCFYTTNTDVVMVYKKGEKRKYLALSNKKRLEYIDALNVKAPVIAKLANNSIYKKMAEAHMQQKDQLNELMKFKAPRLLLS